MNEEPAAAVQHAAQIIERAVDVHIGDIDMPVFVRRGRLRKPCSLLRVRAVPLRQQARLPEHAPDAGKTYRYNVLIQHHEHQPPGTFQRVLQIEIDNGLLFPAFQPKNAGNPCVVFFGLVAVRLRRANFDRDQTQKQTKKPHRNVYMRERMFPRSGTTNATEGATHN